MCKFAKKNSQNGPKLVRSATARHGPHLTLKMQQMGWGTRLATADSGEVGYELRRHAM